MTGRPGPEYDKSAWPLRWKDPRPDPAEPGEELLGRAFELAARQEPEPSPGEIDRAWLQFQEKQTARLRTRRLRLIAVPALAAAAALALVLLWSPSAPHRETKPREVAEAPHPAAQVQARRLSSVELKQGTTLSPAAGETTVGSVSGRARFAALEGSRVEVLDAGPDSIRLRLSRGELLASVRPGAPGRVVILLDRGEVIVTGTVFRVSLRGDHPEVTVWRGSVLVKWDGEETRVAAGGKVLAGAEGRAFHLDAAEDLSPEARDLLDLTRDQLSREEVPQKVDAGAEEIPVVKELPTQEQAAVEAGPSLEKPAQETPPPEVVQEHRPSPQRTEQQDLPGLSRVEPRPEPEQSNKGEPEGELEELRPRTLQAGVHLKRRGKLPAAVEPRVHDPREAEPTLMPDPKPEPAEPEEAPSAELPPDQPRAEGGAQALQETAAKEVPEETRDAATGLGETEAQLERLSRGTDEAAGNALFALAALRYDRLGDREGGVRAWQEYLQRFPDGKLAGDTQAALFSASLKTGRPEAAVKHGEAALTLLPDSADRRKLELELAEVLHLVLGRTEAAIPHYRVLARGKDNPAERSAFLLGSAYDSLGRDTEARAALQSYLERFPDGRYKKAAEEALEPGPPGSDQQ